MSFTQHWPSTSGTTHSADPCYDQRVGAKVAAALKAFGILIAVWGVLIAIGFIAGAIPPTIPGKPAQSATPDDAGTPDAGPTVAQADAAPEVDAGPPEEPDAAVAEVDASVPEAGALWRVAVCSRGAEQSALETAALTRGQLVGDANPELIVACGAEVHVIGFDESRPLRVARFGRAGASQAVRPVVADVDGDGRNDLIVGHTELDEAGSPLGGSLSLLASTAEGGLKAPRALAPIAVSGLAAADMDGRAGAEIGAVHWADGHGLRPSELWLFSGGSAVARRHRARLGNDGRGVAIVDLDADGTLDWVAADATGVHAFGADGRAGAEVELQSASGVFAADLDGDGKDDVLVPTTSLSRITPSPAPAAAAIDGPHGIRRLQVADIDRDGDADIVAVTREHVVALTQDAGSFTQEAWITLPGTLRPHDALVLPNQVVIVASSVRGWELIAVEPARTEVPAAEAPALRDAPLVLAF